MRSLVAGDGGRVLRPSKVVQGSDRRLRPSWACSGSMGALSGLGKGFPPWDSALERPKGQSDVVPRRSDVERAFFRAGRCRRSPGRSRSEGAVAPGPGSTVIPPCVALTRPHEVRPGRPRSRGRVDAVVTEIFPSSLAGSG